MRIKLPWYYWNWWAFVFCWVWYCYKGMAARGFFLILIYIIGIGTISIIDPTLSLMFVGVFHVYCGLFGQRDYLNHLEYQETKKIEQIKNTIKKK